MMTTLESGGHNNLLTQQNQTCSLAQFQQIQQQTNRSIDGVSFLMNRNIKINTVKQKH